MTAPGPGTAVTATAAGAVDSAAGVAPRIPFRPDVEGLRAFAIVFVVAYHAGLPILRGGFIGVDVFFVISGFLITSLLVAEASRSGRVSLAAFWARRARRLLPAAVLVLTLTAAVSWLVIPAIDHALVGGDIVASSLYVSNLRFAAQATDYLDAGRAESPVLNFWSLGVEEQFYLVWPLLVLLVAVALTSRGVRRERLLPALAVVLGVIGVASFAWSLRLTVTGQPWAFFGTPTRAWEFAAGGLVALGTTAGLAMRRRGRAIAGMLGLAMLVGAAVLITPAVQYPGTAAVWPVLGTALLLAAGGRRPDEASVPIDRLLGSPPLRAVGRISYSWYLWHWPVLVLAVAWLGPQSVAANVGLVLLSLVPAVLAYRFIERPIHHAASLVRPPRRALVMGGVISIVGVVAGLVLAVLPGGGALASTTPLTTATEGDIVRTPEQPPPVASASPAPSPSSKPAAPLPPPVTGAAITPAPSKARADLPTIYADGCHVQINNDDPGSCEFGDTASDTSVVLMGDSHAAQWFPALEKAGATNSWKVLARTKSGCAAPDVTIYLRTQQRPYTECDEYRERLITELTGASKPSLVVLTSTQTESLVDRATGERLSGAAARQEWRDGWLRTLRRFSEAGVPVVVLRDTPWPGTDMAKCVSQHLNEPAACDLPLTTLSPTGSDIDLVRGISGAHAIDLTERICSADACPAVIGKYLVYRDDSHLTATFARTLAGRLAAALKPFLG